MFLLLDLFFSLWDTVAALVARCFGIVDNPAGFPCPVSLDAHNITDAEDEQGDRVGFLGGSER